MKKIIPTLHQLVPKHSPAIHHHLYPKRNSQHLLNLLVPSRTYANIHKLTIQFRKPGHLPILLHLQGSTEKQQTTNMQRDQPPPSS